MKNSQFKIESLFNPGIVARVEISAIPPDNLGQSEFIKESKTTFSQCGGEPFADVGFQAFDGGSSRILSDKVDKKVEDLIVGKPLVSIDHENVLLIKYLLDPRVSRGSKKQRVRYRPTEFKTLNAMYQLNKNVGKKWTKFACGKKKIGSTRQKIGRKAITRFICGEGLLFFKKTPQFKAQNIYELEPWVVDLFRFFEKRGMMHGIVDDFKKWRSTFLDRLDKWLLPLLESGHTLQDILVNKLSTRKQLKGADPDGLKGAGIKPTGSHKAFQGSRSNIENPTIPVVNDFVEISRVLTDRFGIRNGDANQILGRYSLHRHKKAATMMDEWIRRGMIPNSPIRTYQTCLNRTC